MRRLSIAPAAVLAGAAGLALEALLIQSSGLALGYGRSGPIGLATFLSGYALGALAAGRWRGSTRGALLLAGLASLVVDGLGVAWVLAAASAAPGSAASAAAAIATILAVAFLQGSFLPLLARAAGGAAGEDRGAVAVLYAASLAGAVAGVALGDASAAAWGRSTAGVLAGSAALVAAVLGAAAAPRGAPARVAEPRASGDLSTRTAGLLIGLSTAWLVTLQWVGIRLGVLWIGGMQPAVSSVLAAALVALSLGAALVPACVPRGPRGVAWTVALCTVGSLWPFAAAWAGGADGWRVLSGGDASARVPDVVRGLALIGPALFPFGGVVPVVHRCLAGESGARLGGLLAHEAWGAWLGIPLAHFVLVPRFGLGGALAACTALGALLFALLWRPLPRASLAGAASAVLLAAFAALRPEPALASPPLADPALEVLAFEEDAHFAAAVVHDGLSGERTLMTDGFRAAGTGPAYRYMRALGSLPLLLHPRPADVCVVALGTGTTLGEVSRHPEVERVEVLEISAAVVRLSSWFEDVNRGASRELRADLDRSSARAAEPRRIALTLGDGRRTLSRRESAYDVITLEPLLPDSPQAVYFYTSDFYAAARRALKPGGLLCQWVPPHALEPAVFAAVLDAFVRSFPWSGVWVFGTQVLLVGAEREPALDASRFPGSDTALAGALAELGLDTPAGLLARWVTGGAEVPRVERILTDADPWTVYRPRRRGAALLADLPENLALLRSVESDPPPSWTSAAGPEGRAAVEALRALRAAREIHAAEEARQRGARVSTPSSAGLDRSLARARAWRADEPELRGFEGELAFLAELRLGVDLLGSDAGRDAGRAALPHLVSAAESSPERADVHLYVAIALERLGESPAAGKALDAALERCPRVAETGPGRRARESLGLSDAAWHRLRKGKNAAAGKPRAGKIVTRRRARA